MRESERIRIRQVYGLLVATPLVLDTPAASLFMLWSLFEGNYFSQFLHEISHALEYAQRFGRLEIVVRVHNIVAVVFE